ncbi:endo-1,4-beta-xylanase [Halococcoides cellulosivorans]|uniref:endo-1,4-beta-xylanase n=1 Tax=Halococcoides cellulosivorans TaxID=1679096 RepID=A0A2R4X450_9EURY|nr:endo-1,4-beta-xylanase [Halococcoides cellulosivorans]AWB28560.1 hypothetical protein HARCEL1_13150 [Halococcoides cellulosivorans]
MIQGGDGDVPAIDRRTMLTAAGTLAGGALVGTVGAATAPLSGVTNAAADWEERADERIDEYRRATLTVTVEDAAGRPVPDATVEVAMQSHDVGFGVGVNAPRLLGRDDALSATDRANYRSMITDLFETAVLTNHHKWRFFEESPDVADAATAWLLDHGLSMRGHTCLWANVEGWAVPGDVVDAMGVDHPSGESGPDRDPAHVRQRSLDHVETILDHYANFSHDGTEYGSAIEHWDVVNEAQHEPRFVEVVDGEDSDPVTAPWIADAYARATASAPDDVALDVNDYNVLVGPYEDTRRTYHDQIGFLQATDGVRLDGVGLQCHFYRDESYDETLTPAQTWAALDAYAAHDVAVRITELDVGGAIWTPEEQATYLRQFLTSVYAHPVVEDVLLWGLWDGPEGSDDYPFYHADWTPKPARDAYRDLVFGEWWTDTSGATDGTGVYATTVDHGTHAITARADGTETTTTVTVAADPTRVTLTLDGEHAADGPPAVDGVVPRDLDEDGVYEDLSGNGRLDFPDVNRLFQNAETDTVQSNLMYFDVTGDGSVDQQDVLVLFDRI